VLITLDTTRADPYGVPRFGTRADAESGCGWAGSRRIFTHAYSQVPLTLGVARDYSHRHVSAVPPSVDFPMPLSKTVPMLPKRSFRAHGYKTRGIYRFSGFLTPTRAAPGLDRAFDIYDAGFQSKVFRTNPATRLSRRRGGEWWREPRHGWTNTPRGPTFCGCICMMRTNPTIPRKPSRAGTPRKPIRWRDRLCRFGRGEIATAVESAREFTMDRSLL